MQIFLRTIARVLKWNLWHVDGHCELQILLLLLLLVIFICKFYVKFLYDLNIFYFHNDEIPNKNNG